MLSPHRLRTMFSSRSAPLPLSSSSLVSVWRPETGCCSVLLHIAVGLVLFWIGTHTAGPVYASSPCDSLVQTLSPLYQRIDSRFTPETPPDGSHRLLRLSRAAQACVLRHSSESEPLPWLPFVGEMAALHALGWHEEALATFESFFDSRADRFTARQRAAALIRRGWTYESQGDAMMAASNFLRASHTQTDWNVREQANVWLQIASTLDRVLDRASEKRMLPRYENKALGLLQSADASLRQTPAWKSDWVYALARRAQSTDSSESLTYARRAVDALSPDVNRVTRLYAYRTYAYRLIRAGQLDESQAYVRRIRALLPDLRAATQRTSHRAIASVFSGRIDLKRERFASAAVHFRDAFDTYRSSASLARPAATAAFLLGRAHERQGAWDAAAAAYRSGLAIADSLRGSIQGTDWAALSTRQWRGLYRGLVRLALRQGD
mgnify:FL=1